MNISTAIAFSKRYKQYTPTQGKRRELPLQPGVNSSKRTDTPSKLKRSTEMNDQKGENDEDKHIHTQSQCKQK